MNKYILFFIALIGYSTTAVAQEYTYDPQGNLVSDANKQIASIHYNYMNLVDTIIYQDGRTIIYTYAASGKKLRQQVILADGTIKQKRDYNNGLLYERDTLREIQHADGRSVPTTPGQTSSSWEYQYHLKDHLGNTRSSITSAPQTTTAVSSFETATGTNGFLRYENARRINALLFDHTGKAVHGGNAQIQETHYSQRLNGSANERYGIARSISVMAGDTVKFEVYAKYIDPDKTNHHAALTTLLTQIAAGTASVGTVADGPGYTTEAAIPFPFAGLNNTDASNGTGPKAYLNWLVFNRDFTFRSGGFVQMTTDAKENGFNVAHEKLETQLVADAPGYVYVYLSNEESKPLEAFFDDFAVTQVMGPVIQENDYDPFGLAFSEHNRENTAPNNFLYNGKELQNDFDLNWYDYGARMYDAAVGRWHVIDPLAEKYAAWTPYQYALNNPIKHIDADGREVFIINDKYKAEQPINQVRGDVEKLYDAKGERTANHGSIQAEVNGGVLFNGSVIDALRVGESGGSFPGNRTGSGVVKAYTQLPPKSSERKIIGDLKIPVTEEAKEADALRELIESPPSEGIVTIRYGGPSSDNACPDNGCGDGENRVLTNTGQMHIDHNGDLVTEPIMPVIVWDPTTAGAEKNLGKLAAQALKARQQFNERVKSAEEKPKTAPQQKTTP